MWCVNKTFDLPCTSECGMCSACPVQRTSVKYTDCQHGLQLSRALTRQLAEGKYLDCVIEVDAGTLQASACIMSSFSDYVSTVFLYKDHPRMQQEHRQVEEVQSSEMVQYSLKLDHLSARAVEALINSAHFRYVDIPSDEISDVLEAAKFLGVPSMLRYLTGEQSKFVRSGYLGKLLVDLNEQRKTGQFLDRVIAIGSLRISAHRLVLGAFSDYFNNNDWEDIEKDEFFQALDPTSVEALVNYAYTGEIVIPSCSVEELMHAANYLDIDTDTWRPVEWL